jgi:mannose/fructose/N-acetylgalactosamine-specific phosphotransferase system component IID
MQHIKARVLALVLIAVSIAIIYLNWHQLQQDHTYSVKMAALGPLVGIGGIYLLFFPSKAGKPTTTGDKVGIVIVFLIGLIGGLINWYLMDPGFFSSK